MFLSDEARIEILKRRAKGERLYEIASAIGVGPSRLSGWLAGVVSVRADDAAIHRLAAYLGVPIARAVAETADLMRQPVEMRSRS
jgi:transcriptional regulator with XRE-family HTH domain